MVALLTNDIYVKSKVLNPSIGFQDIHVNKADKREPLINWNEKLSTFEKLMIIKALREEKLVFAIAQYVSTSLGSVFIESPTVQLNTL